MNLTDLPIWLQVIFWWCVALSLLTGALVVNTLRRQRRQRKARRALNAATTAHILLDREIEQALELGNAARDWALWEQEVAR